ncbi:MAG: ABC transporter permease [Bacillota bacterium]|nr:ABC transporter permease [Bacillota bacterium]
MLRELALVARFAFHEALRKRVLLAGGVLTGVYLLLFGLGLHFLKGNLHNMEQLFGVQLFSMALYLATLLTVLLSAFTGVGAISGEIETGTAYALLAQPVSRARILLGKFSGYALMLALYATLFFLALWGLMAWQSGILLQGVWRVLPLFLLQPLVMLGLAFLGSTLFSTLANGILLFLLYGVALVGGMIEQIGAMVGQAGNATATALINLGIISSLALPVDALYRRAVYILLSDTGTIWNLLHSLGPFGSASVPSVWVVVYAGVYLCGCLVLAVYFFSRKDI